MKLNNIKFPTMNKQDRIADYKSQDDCYDEKVLVKKIIELEEKEYNELSNNLLSGYKMFEKIGGREYVGKNKSILDIEARHSENQEKSWIKAYNSFVKDLQDEGLYDEWLDGMATKCCLVIKKSELNQNGLVIDNNDCFLVNTEGYDYARYVGFLEDNTFLTDYIIRGNK